MIPHVRDEVADARRYGETAFGKGDMETASNWANVALARAVTTWEKNFAFELIEKIQLKLKYIDQLRKESKQRRDRPRI